MGTIKLADFGLSKTLPTRDAKHAEYELDDKFRLTGETGSYRYMAREVFVHEAYNYKVRLLAIWLTNIVPWESYIPRPGDRKVE